MAFKPSAKRSRESEADEVNLLPGIGLMAVLIVFLLASAQQSKMGMIELNLPKAAGGGGGGSSSEPKEVVLKLNVTATLTKDGFYIGSALGVATLQGEPTLPNKGGEKLYDYEGLTKYLADLKIKAAGKFSDLENITLVAESNVAYKYIVWTMDAARTYVNKEGKKEALFPSVSIAAGIM